MKLRYRLIRRGLRGGTFYCVDTATKQRTSLRTDSEDEARQIVEAKNQALRQPVLNLQIAKAYLAGSDPSFVHRKWSDVMMEFVATKTGTNRTRSERAIADKAFDSIRELQVLETRSEHFLRVLKAGKLSTNAYLRRFHNFALDMGWLPWPILPKRQWPAIHYKEKRAVTRDEHDLLLSREPDTVVRWHRLGLRLFWRWKSRDGKVGRKSIAPETVDLIRQMSRPNPVWGAPRVHGELLKLGIRVAQRTVAKHMLPHPRRSRSQTWTSFLRNHLGRGFRLISSWCRRSVSTSFRFSWCFRTHAARC